jgi:hypothetical protein
MYTILWRGNKVLFLFTARRGQDQHWLQAMAASFCGFRACLCIPWASGHHHPGPLFHEHHVADAPWPQPMGLPWPWPLGLPFLSQPRRANVLPLWHFATPQHTCRREMHEIDPAFDAVKIRTQHNTTHAHTKQHKPSNRWSPETHFNRCKRHELIPTR